MNRWPLRLLAPVALMALPAANAAAVSAIPVLPEAVVSGDSIVLADLLPRTASAPLLAAAAKIPLGAAPQQGTARHLHRALVLSALDDAGLPGSLFAIPSVIVIRRQGHPVSRSEIFDAISRELAAHPIPALAALRESDLGLPASVALPSGDPHLRVVGVDFDSLLRRFRFRLASGSDASLVPFFVTVPLPAGVSAASFSLPASAFPHSSARPAMDAPVLVDPRRPARLHLRSHDFDATLIVRPLQRGRLGEVIRVRMPANGRTFRARVVASSSLEAVF